MSALIADAFSSCNLVLTYERVKYVNICSIKKICPSE